MKCPHCGSALPAGVPAWVRQLTVGQVMTADPVTMGPEDTLMRASEVMRQKGIRRIPIVVMTTSSAEQDILRTYDLHANCYIAKPVDLDQFIEVVRSIQDFWLTIVKLPTH